MAQKVSSFDELTAYVMSVGVEAIHIAEEFMDKNSIEFDADGNFNALNVEFSKEKKAVITC
jgi:hypothetical protein